MASSLTTSQRSASIGCVVYPSAAVLSPGVVKHGKNERVSVAELDGVKTDRVRRLSDTLRKAGFKAPVVSNLRAEIWTKLWGNLSFNPISALTHATLEEMCRFPPTRHLAEAIMDEMQKVAEALGIRLPISRDQRLAASEAMGAHKTSMLQDIEKGRPTEADALIASTSEIGKMVGVATPHIDAIYALVTLLTKTLAEGNDPVTGEPKARNLISYEKRRRARSYSTTCRWARFGHCIYFIRYSRTRLHMD